MKSLLASKKRTGRGSGMGGGSSAPSLPASAFQTLAALYDGSLPASQSYSRLSNAWSAESGLIAPHNLLLWSNQFDNATGGWILSTVTSALNAVGPSGADNSAWTITADGTNAGHIFKRAITLQASTTYTVSVYGKAGTNSFGYVYISGTGAGQAQSFNYSTGQLGTVTVGSIISSSIVPSEYGFYRASITFTTGASVASNFIEISNSPTDTAGATSTSGTIIYANAQINNYTLTDYVPTTTAAVYAPIYLTGRSGQAIVIEAARTNVFLNSSATSVPTTQNISLTTAGSGLWTCSVFGAGTVTSSAGTATATGYGAATAGSPRTITVTVNGTVTFTVSGADATTRVNVENAAYPTSFIETGGTATTRAKVDVTFNPTGVITPATGTIMAWVYVAEGGPFRDTTSTVYLFGTSSSGNNNRIQIIKSSNLIQAWLFDSSGTAQATATKAVTLTVGWHHIAFTYVAGANGVTLYIDGVAEHTVTAGAMPSAVGTVAYVGASLAGSGQVDSKVDSFRIFSTPLSAASIMTYFQRGR